MGVDVFALLIAQISTPLVFVRVFAPWLTIP